MQHHRRQAVRRPSLPAVSNARLRGSAWEFERGSRLQHLRRQAVRRSPSPAERSYWRGRGPSRVPLNRGDGDDWLDVRPTRRKVMRQDVRGRNWKREDRRYNNWEEAGDRQSRFVDSRKGPSEREGDYHLDRFSDRCVGEPEEERRRLQVRRRAESQRREEDGDVRGTKAHIRRSKVTAITTTNNASTIGPLFHRFVTFYFTNFPPHLSNFFLRKGFEVCGILEEVVVPRKCNVKEEHYGFVRISNVRDVGKLLKAVNSFCFGNFLIKARVARFVKAAMLDVVRELDKDGGSTVGKKGAGKDGGVELSVVGKGASLTRVGLEKGGVSKDGKGVSTMDVGKV